MELTRGGPADLVVPVWRTAGRSNNNGGQCVEVGAVWRTASRSNNNGTQCVEVGPLLDDSGLIAVRDSTDRSGPALVNSAESWSALLRTIKSTP